jgi:hypothetical protein
LSKAFALAANEEEERRKKLEIPMIFEVGYCGIFRSHNLEMSPGPLSLRGDDRSKSNSSYKSFE